MRNIMRQVPFKEITIDGNDKIVIYDWSGRSPTFCNMQRIASDGSIIWTATPKHPLEGVWTGIRIENGQLLAYNYAGFLDTIDLDTGLTVHRTFTK
jgi:hypothetical protein